METTPQFIQGIFSFSGSGLSSPTPVAASYTVPADKRSQLIYFRAGNSADALVSVTLTKDGKPLRLFPIGAKAAVHVPLVVVEDIMPDSKLEVHVAAPNGASGELVLDIGLMEV